MQEVSNFASSFEGLTETGKTTINIEYEASIKALVNQMRVDAVDYETFQNVLYVLKNSSSYKADFRNDARDAINKEVNLLNTEISIVFSFGKYRFIVTDNNVVAFILSNHKIYSMNTIIDLFWTLKITDDEHLAKHTFQMKTKLQENKRVDELGLVYKVNAEHTFRSMIEVNDILSENNGGIVEHVRLRFRNKFSQTKQHGLGIDMSKTCQAPTIADLVQKQKDGAFEYEIELEQNVPFTELEDMLGKSVKQNKIKKNFDDTLAYLLRNIQQSHYICTRAEHVELYSIITSMDPYNQQRIEKQSNILAPQPVSFKEEQIIKIPDYNVTDKADGKRMLVVIYKNKIYCLQLNGQFSLLHIFDQPQKQYAILDAEFLIHQGQKVLMCFDIYIAASLDESKTYADVFQRDYSDMKLMPLAKRLALVTAIINNVNKGMNVTYKVELPEDYELQGDYFATHQKTKHKSGVKKSGGTSKNNDIGAEGFDTPQNEDSTLAQEADKPLIDGYLSSHFSKLASSVKTISSSMKKGRQSDNPLDVAIDFFLFPKAFLVQKNTDKNDIFIVAQWFYDYQHKKDNDIFYENDGLIFTYKGELGETYNNKSYQNLKWKPNELNSVDLLVRFNRNAKGQIETFTLGDNSNSSVIHPGASRTNGTPQAPQTEPLQFIIAKVYVRQRDELVQYNKFQDTFLLLDPSLLKRGIKVPIDAEGNPVNDNTVVEFVYWGSFIQQNKIYAKLQEHNHTVRNIMQYAAFDEKTNLNNDMLIPLRSRKDKTGKKNPNQLTTAEDTFKVYQEFKTRFSQMTTEPLIQEMLYKPFTPYMSIGERQYYFSNAKVKQITQSMRVYHRIVKYILTDLGFLLMDVLRAKGYYQQAKDSLNNNGVAPVMAKYIDLKNVKDGILAFMKQLRDTEKESNTYLIKNTIEKSFYGYVTDTIISAGGTGRVEKYKVLDIGSGKGGDFKKIKHRASKVAMVEPSEQDLKASAITVAEIIKEDRAATTSNERLHSDKLTVDDIQYVQALAQEPFVSQLKVSKYDFINCSMMIHYLLDDARQFDSFLQNIAAVSQLGTVVSITFMDGQTVLDHFARQEQEQAKEGQNFQRNLLTFQSEGQDVLQIKLQQKANTLLPDRSELKILDQRFMSKYADDFGNVIDVKFFDFMNDFYPENIAKQTLLIDAFKLLGFEVVNTCYNFVSDLPSMAQLQLPAFQEQDAADKHKKIPKVQFYFDRKMKEELVPISQLFAGLILIKTQ